MNLDTVLPILAARVYRTLSGTHPDSVRLLHRNAAVWLVITDGNLIRLVRLPWEDVEDFSLLLTEADPSSGDFIPYVTARLEELLSPRPAA